jgi:hypothetical protein
MLKQPLFAGLVVDENDRPAETAYVGTEPCYVIDDDGFRRHISSEPVDRQVLQYMVDLVKGSEDLISEQTAKMLGQDDLFSVAAIAQQLKNMEHQFDTLLLQGLPEDARAYMGMMGFRVVINFQGEVLRVDQPGVADGEGDQ